MPRFTKPSPQDLTPEVQAAADKFKKLALQEELVLLKLKREKANALGVGYEDLVSNLDSRITDIETKISEL
jgi:hypothetical protein